MAESQVAVPSSDLEKDETPDASLLNDEKKNSTSIYCRICGCLILSPNVASYVVNPTFLHYDKKAAQSRAAALMEADRANGIEVPDVLDIHMEGVNGQTFTHFWKVKDMFQFENIAFTKTLKIDKHKYLTCADCELEIVGIHHLAAYDADPNVIYVSCSRVAYVRREPRS